MSADWKSQLQWHILSLPIQYGFKAEAYNSLNDTGDNKPDNPSMPDEPVTWKNVGLSALLLGFNVVLSMWFGLGLSTSLLIAAVRCVVQLTALGLVLKEIFLTDNPILIFGMTMVLGLLAAFEVTYWRSKRQFPWMYTGTLVSITGSAVSVSLFGNAYALNMAPAYTAVRFIPTVGMIFGKCMIGVSIGLGSVMDSLDTHRDRVETALCYGSSRWEATKPVVVNSLRSALLPTITNMSITGLISIPGMMTGWILGGSDVQEAARYQQIILFMISASTASSTLLSVLFCAFVLVDKTPMLRLDRLTVSEVTQHIEMATGEGSEENRRSRSSLRFERLRSNCRPISEMEGSYSHRRNTAYGDFLSSDDAGKGGRGKDIRSTRSTPLPEVEQRRSRSAGQTDTTADIEDAANQWPMVCGKTGRKWQPAKGGVPAPEYICNGDGRWKGNWCACCPFRPEHKPEGESKSPIECYGYHDDPGDIVIPHPPGMIGGILGSGSKSRESPTTSARHNTRSGPNGGRKVKHFVKGKQQSTCQHGTSDQNGQQEEAQK
ncbi:hypothetical protein IWW48_001290 [Coemansia sp. RSA 1200]|nr:hypothetical protein IWW48_001290 [Coemansia sp. RSA 1200]